MLKQIDNTLPLPKYYQIGESIKEKIAAGQYRPGDKIPTCRELSGYFNTTLVTVSNAMRQLENDGYISKIQGKGMFVTIPATINDKAGGPDNIRKAGLIMHTRGDLYQNLAEVLIHDLEKHDIDTVPQPPVLPDPAFNLAEKEKCLKKYIANGLEALVMDGKRHIPYKLLHKYRADFRQLNFLLHYESGLDFPDANTITINYVQAGRLAAEHLLKAGREKFIFFTFEQLPEAERRHNGCRSCSECHDMDALRGMKAVLRDAGLPESCITVVHDAPPLNKEQNITDFSGLLKQGPWGIFALGDARAAEIYRSATMMGLNIKQNISIVGCYNTAWAEVLYPRLTSISVNEPEIARLAADCIINRKTGQRIVIEPRLIVRET
jgi:DNA-binding LacI/PurR family transcriptional regulator/DNA-binding transcriptional regulator YhcF (GntR family)